MLEAPRQTSNLVYDDHLRSTNRLIVIEDFLFEFLEFGRIFSRQ